METTLEQTTSTMNAVVQRSYGSAETLRNEEIAMPEAGPGEVLIEVHAAGIDRGVWHLMTGMPYVVRLAGFGVTRPKQPVPGFDVSGLVVAVGGGVTRFRKGDEVFGIAGGAYAEYAVAKEEKLSPKPENLTFEQAAVASISGITALQAVTDVAGVQAGDPDGVGQVIDGLDRHGHDHRQRQLEDGFFGIAGQGLDALG